jgi:hypothetical protein
LFYLFTTLFWCHPFLCGLLGFFLIKPVAVLEYQFSETVKIKNKSSRYQQQQAQARQAEGCLPPTRADVLSVGLLPPLPASCSAAAARSSRGGVPLGTVKPRSQSAAAAKEQPFGCSR